jgi:hypothetical protein
MRIGAAMAVWGFLMAAALSERCGHSWTVSLEAGAVDAAALFVAVSLLVTIAGRRTDG